jgi:hypothetical protein
LKSAIIPIDKFSESLPQPKVKKSKKKQTEEPAADGGDSPKKSKKSKKKAATDLPPMPVWT